MDDGLMFMGREVRRYATLASTLLELAYEAWLEMWARTQEAEQTGAE